MFPLVDALAAFADSAWQRPLYVAGVTLCALLAHFVAAKLQLYEWPRERTRWPGDKYRVEVGGDETVVHTSYGAVRGRRAWRAADGGGAGADGTHVAYSWLGIPFAQPPVGYAARNGASAARSHVA